jgi:alkanesulfonate monooxygenase SsuD/methylene tetrahydromethanopterin reductase-like flavin-dependent oxidoreductase (luciferase family)
MELGLYSFGDSSIDPNTGQYMPENVIFRNLLERIKLADEVGLNYFGLGEHHREDYPVSAPAILLAAAVTQTERIHLGSAVTVLPTKDPVRVFQQFATIDQISEGRAELTVGTGAYVESYPLFGHELADSQANFTEKLGLLKQLNEQNPISFKGKFRAPLEESGIWPRPYNEKLNIWVATGETLESSERAASFGFNANYSFLSTPPASKKAVVEHFRASALANGHQDLKVAVAGRGFVADKASVAKETMYRGWLQSVTISQKERGREAPSREMFEEQANGTGPILAGDPNEVADRLAAIHAELKHDRHILHFDIGNIDHASVMKAIELFGTRVLPQVAKLPA